MKSYPRKNPETPQYLKIQTSERLRELARVSVKNNNTHSNILLNMIMDELRRRNMGEYKEFTLNEMIPALSERGKNQ